MTAVLIVSAVMGSVTSLIFSNVFTVLRIVGLFLS